jgi:hypothetical protein
MAERKAKAKTVANTTVDLNELLDKAKAELGTSKDRAMNAVAYCYVIWTQCQTDEGKDWFEAEVKAANAVIERDNKKITEDRARIKKFESGKLPKSDPINETGDDPEAKAECEKAKVAMAEMIALYNGDRAPKAKKTVEVKDGIIDFITVVKVVFDLYATTDASLVSRYATVCSYIHARFKDVALPKVTDIVKALVDAGGFEASYSAQVTVKKHAKSDAKGDEVKLMEAKAQEVGKQTAQAIAAVQSFDMAVKTVAAGFTVLLARTNGSKVEVVGEAPVSEAQITKLVSAFETPGARNDHPTSEFVHRVLSLGELVGGGLTTTEDEKGERKLSMRKDEAGKAQLLMSLKKESAGVVVHATPQHPAIDLGSVPGLLVLSQEGLKKLSQRMTEPLYRRFTLIEPDTSPKQKSGADADSKLAWDLVNEAAVKEGETAKRETIFWSDATKSANKPTDIEDAKFKTCLIVGRDVVMAFYDEVVSKLKADRDPKKKGRNAQLTYEGGNLTLEVPAKAKVVRPVTAHMDDGAKLEFRPSDVVKLVEAMKAHSAPIYYFQMDEGGLLGVKWSDNVGSYGVYVPSVQTNGLLNPKRISKANVIAADAWANLPMSKVNAAPTKRVAAKKPVTA